MTARDDPLSIIHAEATATATAFGLTPAEDFATALVERIANRLGGDRHYIPRKLNRREIKTKILARHNGHNTAGLAREFGVSVQWVNRIVQSA